MGEGRAATGAPAARRAAAGDRAYIASLTGLRGVAAFGVFLFHYAYIYDSVWEDLSYPYFGYFLKLPFGIGFAGVDLFFVLSGFLLTLPFARAAQAGLPHPRLGHYFRRRVLRVFPAYYAQLAIILAVGSWFVIWQPLHGRYLVAHLFMFFNLGSEPVSPMIGLWWTLPVEFGFYLLLPFIAYFMKPGRWLPILAAGLLLGFLYRVWAVAHFIELGPHRVFLAASQLPGALPLFLLGASGALLAQRASLRGSGPQSPLAADAMFAIGAVLALLWLSQMMPVAGTKFWYGHPVMLVAPIALGLPLALMVSGLYRGSRIGRWLLANPVVYFIGLISYSLYLWHFPVLQQIDRYGGEAFAALAPLAKFVINALAVIAVSAASYFLFERPFFRLRGRRRPSGQ